MRKHSGVRVGRALGKIGTVILLGVGTIAMVIPGSALGLGQSAPRAQAPLFTAIDLHPSGFTSSDAYGTSGGQHVGYGVLHGAPQGTNDMAAPTHALLWRGSAASVVDLNPRGFASSQGYGICGGQQVGHGSGPATVKNHALLWRGTAGSMVDLHPSGFEASKAVGTSGGQQVGYGVPHGAPEETNDVATPTHALLWRGSAASVVDLHPHGFLSSTAYGTDGEEQVGYGSPEGLFLEVSPTTPVIHALMWHSSPASVVDLHPRTFILSWAEGTFSEQQVGYGYMSGGDHALLWRGSAASAVDLHPRGFSRSVAHSTNGEEQVGDGVPGGDYFHSTHALLWRGTAASVVDLHAFLPQGFVNSFATSIDSSGDIIGWAYGSYPTSSHAFLWRRNIPKPSTSREKNAMRC